MDDAVRNLLKHQPWNVLTPKLAAFAAMRCKLYYDGTCKPHAFSGRDPIDFAHEAIELVYSGDRAWDPVIYPDVLIHLKWVVRNLISNAVKSKDNKLRMSDQGSEDAERSIENNQGADATACVDSVADTVIQEDVIVGFCEFLSGEPDLQRIAECIYYGNMVRADIAECAGIAPQDLSNARKRLQVRYRAYLKSRE